MTSAIPDPRAEIERLLARRGHRLTAPRRAIVDALAASPGPATVADIHGRIRDRRPNIVSVYRTVKLLAGAGLLRATDSTQGEVRYELTERFTGHHHHLFCQRCGSVQDLAGCLLDEDVLIRLGQRVRQSRRFRVTDHELRFFGVCGECAA